jgi:hypothetical protein
MFYMNDHSVSKWKALRSDIRADSPSTVSPT